MTALDHHDNAGTTANNAKSKRSNPEWLHMPHGHAMGSGHLLNGSSMGPPAWPEEDLERQPLFDHSNSLSDSQGGDQQPSIAGLSSAGTSLETSTAEHRLHTCRVVASSIIGNTLEWYDFLIYVYLGSIISHLFFPSDNKYTRLLSFYGIFAAGFFTRPLGATMFGYIGDKYSRKTALMLSIYIMSIPTALVGCLPTYEQAGIIAPILLVLVRIVQGFAVGGEFTSTMVFLVEHAAPQHAGLQGSWAFFSVMVGVITGSFTATFFSLVLSEQQLQSWGWRIPFLLSILGSAVGAYIRNKLKDVDTGGHGKSGPLKKALFAVVTVIMIDFLTAIGFYLVVIFLPLYFQEFTNMPHSQALGVHTANMLLYAACIPLGGWLSDRYGRRPVMALPSIGMLVLSYPLWLLFRLESAFAAWCAQAVMSVLMALFNGVLPATFVALFPPEYRCTGVSVAHNISMAIFGGTAPMVATALMQRTGNITAPAAMLIFAGALSTTGALMTRYFNIH